MFGLKLEQKEKGKEMQVTWNHPSSEDGDTAALLPRPACVLTERGAGRERTRAGCSWSGKLALGIKYGM